MASANQALLQTAVPIRRRPSLIQRVLRHRSALVGLVVVVASVGVAMLAPGLATHDPFAHNLERQLAGPGRTALLGTDHFGRDVYSRVVWGARNSLLVAVVSLFIGATAGVLLGLVGGYFGGLVDSTIVRLVDALMSFPLILLAIFAVSILGFGTANVVVALGISLSPRFARVVRSQVLALMARDFVEAARAVGAGHVRIMLRHVLVNALSPIIVMVTLYLPYTILVESSLSFLGIGVSPDTPTWGRIIADGAQYLQIAPWISVSPGLAIALTAMGFNLLGDGLRDVLDPKLRGEAR
jgi:ABC-type dipeptide/oligopeptide/nickel transport system permease subunit